MLSLSPMVLALMRVSRLMSEVLRPFFLQDYLMFFFQLPELSSF